MFNFSQKYRDFILRHPRHDAFVNIIHGSVRSGKTFCTIPKILIQLNDYQVEGRKVIFGVSKQTVYNNVLSQLFDFAGRGNYSFNRQTGELTLLGKKWLVVGAKDEGSERYIRGLTVGVAVGDELTLHPEGFFKMMLSRLSPEGARLYGTTNPDSPYHYLKTEYLDDAAKHATGDVWDMHCTMRDNLSLSQAKIAQYERMYKGVFYDLYIRGLWTLAEGVIYKDSLGDDILYDDDTRPVALLNTGGSVESFIPIDYGTGNATVFLHVVDDGTTYWVDDEYYWDSRAVNQQKTDAQYATDLQEFLATHCPQGARCIIDPSAASFKAELVQRGVWHVDADNSVEDGIRVTSSLLAQRKVRIHKRCVNLWSQLNTYVWDKNAAKRGEDKPMKVNDHSCDALRYGLFTMCPSWRVAA